jgi:hypothetical protein
MVPKLILLGALLLFLFHSTHAEECVAFNATLKHSVCTPHYLVFLSDYNQTSPGNSISEIVDNLFESFPDVTNPPVPESCIKLYIAFFCSDYYPQCALLNSTKTSNNISMSIVGACSSACNNMLTACNPYTQYFTTQFIASLPSVAQCNSLYSTNTSLCTFSLDTADTEYWYDDDTPPSPSTSTTTTSTTGPPYTTTTQSSFNPYPGGATNGGLLGAGLLVAILIIISLVGLFMKNQEKR